MISKLNIVNSSRAILIAFGILLGAGLTSAATPAKEDSATSGPVNQKQFASAKEAADALVQAAAAFDQAALKEILGPESDGIITSEEQVQDKNRAVAFAEMAKQKRLPEKKGGQAILEVGKDDVQLPI